MEVFSLAIRAFLSSALRATSLYPPPSTTATTNLTTSLYHTLLSIFAQTWTRTFIGRSLHLHLLPNPRRPASSIPSSFRLNLNPLLFWKKHGSQKLLLSSSPATNLWDITKSTFGSGPDPHSGFYIAVIVDSELVLLVGDLRPTTLDTRSTNHQALVARREHVHGTKLHRTNTMFGGSQRIDVDGQPILLSWESVEETELKGPTKDFVTNKGPWLAIVKPQ